ncbi:MAG: hypothetical protein M3389_16915, partial [Actinomycetota bacterium]|nr:hypothetical protein [Actinomycetota bacterium]
MLRPFFLALLAGLAVASPSSAATVQITFDTVNNEWRVLYEAAPGERNDVRVRNTGDYSIRVSDPAVPVAAGERCRAVDEHTAECSVPSDAPYQGFSRYLSVALVRTGDGNDVARVDGGGG